MDKDERLIKTSCYGCKYNGYEWSDMCKQCVRMTIIEPFKDKYAIDSELLTFPELALEASLQEFDSQEPRLTAEWVAPDDPMWYNPTCSNCDFESADHRNYCPNCGAKIVGFIY